MLCLPCNQHLKDMTPKSQLHTRIHTGITWAAVDIDVKPALVFTINLMNYFQRDSPDSKLFIMLNFRENNLFRNQKLLINL